jgi:hypothetical protein
MNYRMVYSAQQWTEMIHNEWIVMYINKPNTNNFRITIYNNTTQQINIIPESKDRKNV